MKKYTLVELNILNAFFFLCQSEFASFLVKKESVEDVKWSMKNVVQVGLFSPPRFKSKKKK